MTIICEPCCAGSHDSCEVTHVGMLRAMCGCECRRPHRCGPTPEQVLDASLRGDMLGTWERCPECAKAEDALLARISFYDDLKDDVPGAWLNGETPIRSILWGVNDA